MTNGQNATRGKHLDDLAKSVKRYLLQEILDVTEAVTAELENISIGGGSSSSSDGIVLPTVASAVDGGLWYEVTDNSPMIYLRQGNYAYGFNFDRLKYVGDLGDALVAYLPFENTLDDLGGNTWATTGNVSFSTDIKKFGTSSLYLQNGNIRTPVFFELNSERWTFDEWIFLDTKTGEIFTCWTSTDWRVLAVEASGSSWILNSNYSYGPSFSLTFPSAVWFHFAVVKDGNNVHFFVDGVKQQTATLSTAIPPTDSTQVFLIIGNKGGNFHVDNVRFFKDVALWTETFTPPTDSDYV